MPRAPRSAAGCAVLARRVEWRATGGVGVLRLARPRHVVGGRHRRGLAFKNSVPEPTKEERLAFLREMSSKPPEPEPEPPSPWAQISQGSPSGSIAARHQASIVKRRQIWETRGASSAESDERINAALSALFDERST
jgi:hypothetical protein